MKNNSGISTFVSVVMPSYNQAAFLGEAIDSVLGQSWPHLELIVQDGGSTDGSQSILQAKAQQDSRLRWHSEPDSGPAQALNRALKQARGNLIGWLNSDDRYTQGAIQRAVQAFEQNPNWLLCYGEGEHIDAEGKTLNRYPTKANAPKEAFQDGCFICQPTVFFKKAAHTLLGALDETLGASFDFDYWLRAYNGFENRIGYLPAVQAQSRLHEACITSRQRERVAMEGMAVLARHQGSAPGHWLLSYLRESESTRLNQEKRNYLLNLVKPYMQTREWNALKLTLANAQE
ncbi:MAG: glycosyltransferase [Alkalimonas sp.]|nr:glycosyltransferase [Saccharospirillum sp.]MCH8536963.1 glycosyltransferase [Alkalimonas sp.]